MTSPIFRLPILRLTASTALVSLFAAAAPQIAGAQTLLCPEGVPEADLPAECREDGVAGPAVIAGPEAETAEPEQGDATEEDAEKPEPEDPEPEDRASGTESAPESSPEPEAKPDPAPEEAAPETAPEPEPEPEPEPAPETAETPDPKPAPDAPAPDAPVKETGEEDAGAGPEITGPANLAEDLAEEVRDGVDAAGDGLEEAAEGVSDAITGETGVETPRNEGRPAAAAAGEGAGEPAETTRTTVTEDTARSSDEDFVAPEARTSDGDSGGLSNFEKFALGAAGLVVLDQLIGANDEVVSNTGDRVVVRRDDGQLYVLKDDDVLLRRPGSEVETETFRDGSTRTTITREDGVQVVTISAADGTMLRRTKVLPDGRRVVLFDDTQATAPVDLGALPPPSRDPEFRPNDEASLRAALDRAGNRDIGRRFTLSQVRNIAQVRELVPEINIDAINFETGSAAIRPEEAEDLYTLGEAMRRFIDENPDELFLIEGHTDAVGSDVTNLALSDRRAESVALALAEYFNVPPENMVVQGYGERFLLVPTDGPERVNRRATVRRVTPLIDVASVR